MGRLDREGPIAGPAGSLIGDNHSSDSNEEEAHSRPPLSIRSGRMDEFASVTVAVMTPAGLAVGVVSYGVVSSAFRFVEVFARQHVDTIRRPAVER